MFTKIYSVYHYFLTHLYLTYTYIYKYLHIKQLMKVFKNTFKLLENYIKINVFKNFYK